MSNRDDLTLRDRLKRLGEAHKAIERSMGEIAWELTPRDIQKLLTDYFGEDNTIMAMRWLIKSRWEFWGRSPIELILEGRNEEVRIFIARLNSDTYM